MLCRVLSVPGTASRTRSLRIATGFALGLPLLTPATARAAATGTIAVRNDGATFAIPPNAPGEAAYAPGYVPPAREASAARVDEAVDAMQLPALPGHAAESVIGTDDRTQVTNTTVAPNRAIAHLVVSFPTGSYVCSAWFIDDDRLATAAHCLYQAAQGGFATAITVYPGRNGGTAPYGGYAATNWYVTQKWVNGQQPMDDYGIIKLGSDVGLTVGWFGYAWTTDDTVLRKRKIKVRGYPGDKPTGTMWTMSGKIKQVTETRFFYGLDTAGGQSGSPAFGKLGACNPCSFGIHTYGLSGTWTRNSATRITGTVASFLNTVAKD